MASSAYFSANAATYAYYGSGASDGYYYAAAAQYYDRDYYDRDRYSRYDSYDRYDPYDRYGDRPQYDYARVLSVDPLIDLRYLPPTADGLAPNGKEYLTLDEAIANLNRTGATSRPACSGSNPASCDASMASSASLTEGCSAGLSRYQR